MAEGIGSGGVSRLQTREEEERMVCDRVREAGAMECVRNKLAEGDGRLCRLSVNRY
jgi:hypothetical protein